MKSERRWRAAVACVLALGLGLPLTSCGGGFRAPLGLSGGSGSVTFRVIWPATPPGGRLIPVAANSIKITLQDGAKIVGSKVISKPAGGGAATAQIKNVEPKTLSEVAEAFPTLDGTGVAQAAGSAMVTVERDKDTMVTITMADTIDHLTVSAYGYKNNQYVPVDAVVAVGKNVTLVASGVNANGEQVVVLASKMQWSSDDPSIATVDGTGIVTGVKLGTTTVTAKDPESGKSGSAPVTVSPVVYTIGGPGADGSWEVDDNLDVFVNGSATPAFSTGNSQSGTHPPFTIKANKGDTVKIQVRDTFGFCTSLSPLYLTDNFGNSELVDPGFDGGCGRPGGDQGVSHTSSFTISFPF